jgi:hypothetical protein
MKIIRYIIVMVCCLFVNCKTKVISLELDNSLGPYLEMDASVYLNNHYFNCSSSLKDFAILQWLLLDITYIRGDNPKEFNNYSGFRNGHIVDGKQTGKWVSERTFDFDSLGFIKTTKYINREEYFKNGLHDSIYKIYNKEGKVIYSTTFNQGTGLEKDYHENGKLYYEIATKDGYFTDTLKLYNDKGKLMEKRLYKKDSLVYHENFIFDENPTDNK